MISENYVTNAEAAALMSVNPLTIYLWVKSGKLRAERVGKELLILRDDLSQMTKSTRGRKPKKRPD